MGILERSLEENVAQSNRARTESLSASNNFELASREEEFVSGGEEDEDIKDLRSSEFVREDAAYFEDEDADDDVVDLGVALGKLRINERIGGLVRPKFGDELEQALKELPKRDQGGAVDWMLPSSEYVAPSSSFFFTPGAERTTLMNYLPAKGLVDKLMAHYWQAVHLIAKTMHRPSFERHYERFWKSVASGVEPRNSFQAVLFAAMLSSVISMSGDKVLNDFGVDRHGLVDNFREATEAALSRANLLRTTKLETLQAFVMYLIPLCRAEVSRAHSALTGTCIRLAECMGLHKDPSEYSTSPIECQVRRLIWHQICYLDMRTCEATGPRPQIRPDDYETRLPLNIDDTDLDRAEQGDLSIDVKHDRAYFTDMTITRMRFECSDMSRYLWIERPKLEKKPKEGEKKVTINSLLARIQSFRAAMEKTYLPMLNRTAPLHALASEIYGILSNRLYIQILQKYLTSDKLKMPERLRQIVLSAAIMILEHSQNIEEQPMLSMWSWYIGALHQYHGALLILNELYAQPGEPVMEQRAWRALDFVFGMNPGMSNREKTRAVLEELVNKLQVYASVKRWRAPIDMPQAKPRTDNPGYQRQQQAAQARAPAGSLQSAQASSAQVPAGSADSPGMSITPLVQHRLPPKPPRGHSAVSGSIAFPGAMPNSDWGTLDVPLPSSITGLEQPTMHPPNNYQTPTTPATYIPPRRGMPQSSDPGTVRPTLAYGVSNSSTDSSPMNALNDIDWNEIDQLFGGAETGTDNMMIPPFTFPQFSATDLTHLQWPQEGYR
ncbi:hypothetical protein E8E13_010024 [Curvularia kusanoi]|uniref:Xylanolytic transcriptional activator regulatory domain-containing protein n=1 Tax=Curvularia kusanoi TaxID=90978 RepID=A0A9P4TIC7_CURKU|nr:hypothetical protein E8E13_010024 [Curvularia kusanoi]